VFSTLNTPVACIVPYGLSTTAITNSTAQVNWTNLVSADTFRVRYSVNGTTNFAWKDVSGAGGTTSAPLAGLAASTTYQWQVRTICNGVAGAYSSSVLFTTLAQRSAAISGTDKLHDVLLYPNPARSNVTLQFDADATGQGMLIMYDVAGREVYSENLRILAGKNSMDFSIENLPRGIYLVVIKGDDLAAARINLVVE